MIPVTTYEKALIAIRNQILIYSGIPNNFILNGDSIYGPDIWKMITDTIGEAPDHSNTFIVFEFKEIPNDSFGITDEFTALAPYGLFLKIYGDDCHMVAYKLASIFKYADVIEVLRDSGVKVMNGSTIGSVNEFINNTRWSRCDVEIDVLCNFDIKLENMDDPGYANSIALPINKIIIKGDLTNGT